MRATVTAHRDYTISKIDDRVYGAFLEHLGRAIYTGIYEPDHPTADKNGMRGDVAQLVRDLKVPMVRYPGGNFVSAYNWEDGIGPRDQRPTRLDLAWHTSDSNAVGVHEFADWCAAVDTQMMLAVNLALLRRPTDRRLALTNFHASNLFLLLLFVGVLLDAGLRRW